MDSHQVRSRTVRHTQNKNNTANKNTNKKKTKLSISLIITLALFSLIIGALIGYGVLGNKNPVEVFDLDTWMHLINLIFG